MSGQQGKVTVLVIDDEIEVLKGLTTCLEDCDYNVITADGGRKGLELFRQTNPDIVISDLRMPEVSGLDVIKAINHASPDTPVIMLSGTGMLQDAVTAIRIGAWDYLMKPIEDTTILLHSIKSHLDKARLIKENKKYHMGLERLLEERTADLRAAMDAAQAANRAKDEFLANMSHELRTPLNAILGFTNLTLLAEQPPQHKEYLEIVRRSGMELLDIINDILDLSKIEAERIDLRSETFSPRTLVEEAVKTASITAKEKSLQLIYEISPSTPEWLIGDSFHIRRLMMNLLNNAINFTFSGHVFIKLGMDGSVGGDGSLLLHITVSDTGPGIPKELHESIFEPFNQADNSSTREYGGVGLGLTLCRRLLDKLEGKIWVESEMGKGSSFHFTVPCKTALSPEAAVVPSEESTQPPLKMPSLDILVAEDDPAGAEYVNKTLLGAGHSVFLVKDGVKCLEAIAKKTYDVILMDMKMRHVDGIEATRRIRENENSASPRRHTPIIALTANAMACDKSRCIDAGMDAYLSKPFQSEELLATIASTVQKGKKN